MGFNKKKFDEFILENKVVGIKEEPFKLKSGRLSHWYANCRVLSDTYELLNNTADFAAGFISKQGIQYDYVYGVPEGATKLGMAINMKLGKKNPKLKMVIGRKEPKGHGDARDKYFIGPVEEGDKVIVFEDVTTTGGSVIEHLNFLKEAKVNIVAVVSLVNRLEKREDGKTVAEYIKDTFGIDYYWLSDAKRLLPLAVEKGSFSEDILAKVQDNLNEFSSVKIKLKKKETVSQ